jgi:hypothetical protein
MTAFALFVAAMAIFVAPIAWLMFRAHRADQRKIERIREDWEGGGREKPWTLGGEFGGGGSSNLGS